MIEQGIPQPGRRSIRGRAIPVQAAAAVKPRLDPYRFGLAILVVLSISRLHGYFSVLQAVRPALLLVVFCTAYAFMNPRKLATGSVLRTWPAKGIIALSVLACFSALFGISQGRAGNFIIDNYSKTIVTSLLLVTAVRGPGDLRRLVWAAVVGGGILAFLSIFIVGISKTTSAVTYDANDVGVIMVVTLPLALLLFQVSRFPGRFLSAAVVIMVGSTIAMTQSRGAFLGTLAIGASLLLALPGVSVIKRGAFVILAASAMAIAAPAGYWDSMKSILENPKNDYNYNDVNGRRMLAKRGMGYMLSYPIFGIGINNFPMAEGQISDKAKFHIRGTGIRWAAAHNSFVQAGAELGVPGLLLFIGMILGAIIGVSRMRRRLPKSWLGGGDDRFLYLATVYFPIAMLGFAMAGFFVSFAWTDLFYILCALFAGLYVCLDARLRAAVPAAQPLPGRGSLAAPAPAGERSVVLLPSPEPGKG